MKNKKIYAAPQTLVYQIKLRTAFLTTSMTLYKNEETNNEDEQYSRRRSIWEDEEVDL